MSKKPQYAAVPRRAIWDERLTDRDFRILATVASFDRLSSHRKAGQGAWASHGTMAKMVRSDYSRFSTSINKLLGLDYLSREPMKLDRRKFTYRVLYDDADHLPLSKVFGSENATEADEKVCRDDNHPPEIVCGDNSENPEEQPETPTQYISLREEIDSVETGEIHSLKGPHLAARLLAKGYVHEDENVGAALAIVEREWTASDDPLGESDDASLTALLDWLRDISENELGEINGRRAERLHEVIDMACWESHRGPYKEEAA